MDPERFDGWAERLAHAVSRRGALRGLAAATTGLLTACFAGLDAEAKKKKKGKGKHKRKKVCAKAGQPCTPRKTCCGKTACRNGRCGCGPNQKACQNRCIAKAACCADTDCGGGVCQTNGQCACPEGRQNCAGVCVDTNVNADHCGGCGAVCKATEQCRAGECVVVVSQTAMSGWEFWSEVDGGRVEPTFVSGPGSMPFGTGSAQVILRGNPAAPMERTMIRREFPTTITIGGLTALRFSDRSSLPGCAVALLLDTGISGGAPDGRGRFIYDPGVTRNHELRANEWRTWDALADPNQRWCAEEQSSPCSRQHGCCTFAEMLARHSELGHPSAGKLVVGLRVGDARDVAASETTIHVDGLRIGASDGAITIYDFEP
ncbi:MAG: hypothetical protein IT337_16050 [Thermomicrobiales bacterium]|nr:hypothetical protein [Thermomicrobiales bacterium]